MTAEDVRKCIQRVCTTEYTRRQKKHGVSAKLAKEGCRLIYCNPTCKNTSFGSAGRLSKKLRMSPLYKRGEEWRVKFEQQRKKLGTRKILANGFYVKIPKKEVARARRSGEISGCHI